MPLRKFTAGEIEYIIGSNEIAVVHLDAEWDGYRLIIEQKINEILIHPPADVVFAYVDVDEQMELARSLKVIDVPTVAYFCNGKLVGSVIGIGQDISKNIERIRSGEQLDTSNTVSGSNHAVPRTIPRAGPPAYSRDS